MQGRAATTEGKRKGKPSCDAPGTTAAVRARLARPSGSPPRRGASRASVRPAPDRRLVSGNRAPSPPLPQPPFGPQSLAQPVGATMNAHDNPGAPPEPPAEIAQPSRLPTQVAEKKTARAVARRAAKARDSRGRQAHKLRGQVSPAVVLGQALCQRGKAAQYLALHRDQAQISTDSVVTCRQLPSVKRRRSGTVGSGRGPPPPGQRRVLGRCPDEFRAPG
jgi:hypothetical protein